MTLRQAEEETGLSKDTISRLERGLRTPQPLTAAKLAEAYGRSIEEFLEAPKAQAPLPLDNGEERGHHQYPWMSDVLTTLISTWERQVEERHNPAQSRTIMVAALDMQDAVTFNYRGRWEQLSEQEKGERKDLAVRLETLAIRGIDHYKESKQAEAAELEAVERRREEIKAATRRISA
jgi:transcriptional regulator with XRE-family HTH domain